MRPVETQEQLVDMVEVQHQQGELSMLVLEMVDSSRAPPMTYPLSLTTANAKVNSGSGGGGGGFGRPTYSPGNQQHRSGSGGSGIIVIAYPT